MSPYKEASNDDKVSLRIAQAGIFSNGGRVLVRWGRFFIDSSAVYSTLCCIFTDVRVETHA